MKYRVALILFVLAGIVLLEMFAVSEIVEVLWALGGAIVLLTSRQFHFERLVTCAVLSFSCAIAAHLWYPFRAAPIVELPLLVLLVWIVVGVIYDALLLRIDRSAT